MRSQLVIAHALPSDPEAEYCDLGTGYYEQRAGIRRQARSHVRSLERLGYKVTIEPLTPEVDPETGELWSPGNFVDISIMLLLVPNCQIGARNPLGLSCRADVVSGRDCNIARCSRTRRS